MSTDSGFKPNLKAFVDLRNSAGVTTELRRRAISIADAAGPGFEVKPTEENRSFPKGRARVAVVAMSFEARYAEATDRALTRALDAGRG